MFDEFQKEVLDAYRKMRDKHELPTELENLTRSNLRRHALMILSNRYDGKDDEVIKQFFDPENTHGDHEKSIRRFELDKFRPIVKFLAGKVKNTDERNVKILAWLIDFEPRPYARWRDERAKQANNEHMHAFTDVSQPATKGGIVDTTSKFLVLDSSGKPKKSRNWMALFYFVLASMVGIAIYVGTKKQCMYWKEDRYVSIHCNEKIDGVEIIPIKREVVRKFRKIMQPDTITLKSVGRLWYGKPTVETVAFYTMEGVYPMDRRKELRPATEYIIKKYVLDKQKEQLND